MQLRTIDAVSLHLNAIADLLIFTQGLLLGALFLSNFKGNRYVNILLGLFILTFNFGSLHSFFITSGLVSQHRWLLGFPSLFLFWFGPLLYFYTRSVTQSSFTWKRGYTLWFIPAMVELLGNFILLSLGGERLVKLAYNSYFTWGMAFHSFVASLFSVYLITRSLRLTSNNLPPLKRKWLTCVLFYFSVRFTFWALYFALVFALAWRYNVAAYTQIVISIFALMDVAAVFGISAFSFRHMHDMHLEQKGTAYALSAAQEELYFGQLLQLMEQEKLYRKPDLKLSDIAERLNTNVKYISQLVRLRTSDNFPTFVNKYRVEEIKAHLVDQRFRHLTMAAIAEESGFSSKATFNRVFKEITGTSPKSYKDSVYSKI